MTEQELIEQLADKEHASWARWMAYLFTKCEDNPDGSLTIPSAYVTALQSQMDTAYADLYEREKQYDRDEVAHILPIIHKFAQSMSNHPHNRPVIVLDRDFFEHLLNALATQKFLYHINADGLSEGEEKVKQMQSESQQAIDAAWRKGMDILYKSTKDEGISA